MVTFCYFCTLSTIYFKYTQLLCYYLSSKTDKIRISIILHNWYLGRILLLNIHFLQFLPRFFGNWYDFDVHRLHKIGDYTKRWMSYLGDHQSMRYSLSKKKSMIYHSIFLWCGGYANTEPRADYRCSPRVMVAMMYPYSLNK